MCMCIAALSQSRRAPGLSQRRPTPAVQWPPVRAIKHGCAFLSLAVSVMHCTLKQLLHTTYVQLGWLQAAAAAALLT
eukprot:scaffold271528_cov19-Tisochrysis_lutea.AAC.1